MDAATHADGKGSCWCMKESFPPELLTRDHVARCIRREVKAGRGSPHGGVFLDIAWIKSKLPNGAEHIRKKLPSMYHQFMQLANIDITTTPENFERRIKADYEKVKAAIAAAKIPLQD